MHGKPSLVKIIGDMEKGIFAEVCVAFAHVDVLTAVCSLRGAMVAARARLACEGLAWHRLTGRGALARF